ncbi:alpha/beta hydrolase [Amycolatopsis umgeniensis]|uniref:Pimeloyl-ACP methyl ester carboxylesterase n=1 Tax=Amycolatopsis umgeniensis TaxID=336628 RepID=A0A841ASJ8_9PSEU|nr:alpha/beta hydrolase [Amycolatopsis umgeniensis]MBB5851809.1 pimeloyl-ACP methyl ester carboxylesterase [Amycolatopsis umgeniensis]
MKRLLTAGVIPVVVGGLLAGALPASASTLNTTNIPGRYTGQTLDWHPCAAEELVTLPPGTDIGGLECASYRTPRDWDRANERQDLTIAVSRMKSTGPSTASVLTNPGGPGAPGRWFPVTFRGQDKLREHQDVIGIDVRGTGKSTNVTCRGTADLVRQLDPRDRDPRNLNQILANAEHVAKSCQSAGGELGPLITTYQTIKDFDLLRVLLGREKINWVGYSGGTWLGAHYAQQFPQRTGRFVLDSSTEFTTTWQNSFNRQPVSFERRWRQDFLPWMARYDAKYHFGTSGEEVRQTYERVRYALSRNPMDGKGPMQLESVMVYLLYKKASFPALADLMVKVRDAMENPQAKAGAKAAFDAAGDFSDAGDATFWNTLCGEGRFVGTRESLIRDSQRNLDRGLLMAGGGTLNASVCLFWDKQPRPLPKLDGKGVPPVLIVQSEHDPGTAIEGARRAHAGFANSRMLTVTGEGDHGLYADGNPAVDKIVDAYLVDGVVPADQSVPGMPLPVPAP